MINGWESGVFFWVYFNIGFLLFGSSVPGSIFLFTRYMFLNVLKHVIYTIFGIILDQLGKFPNE